VLLLVTTVVPVLAALASVAWCALRGECR
jgi:hypothetical protein